MNTEDKTGYRENDIGNYNEAVIGGGCFWGMEAVFELLKGVESVESGYAGGTVENPTYEEVSAGATGHAEVIRIKYDPEVISCRKLLEVFFYMHDPTTKDRQGNDRGSQYRSIILYGSESQEQIAMELIEELEESNVYSGPIVTEIKPLYVFYPAEDYHQDYFGCNEGNSYCQQAIVPKLDKLKERFGDILK
ncbi:MAG: peptide-methionine (S)-S-oxide reductase MsrA [Actinomycetota bacterium]|nr:peptide-methionine (S)-S-oxide reductase MsrA [Actinomycetota bacterium]